MAARLFRPACALGIVTWGFVELHLTFPLASRAASEGALQAAANLACHRSRERSRLKRLRHEPKLLTSAGNSTLIDAFAHELKIP